jgi:FMN phosphatase YigB (HAD superfamily)
MIKKIIFDLDGTLRHGSQENPDAISVLERAKKDYNEVIMWTLNDKRLLSSYIEKSELTKYFDTLISLSIPESCDPNIYWALYNNRMGQEELIETESLMKDICLLGNPNDYVMLDDLNAGLTNPLVSPLERVVQVFPFGAICSKEERERNSLPSLSEAYDLALKKFQL